jgi:hypothetical protein
MESRNQGESLLIFSPKLAAATGLLILVAGFLNLVRLPGLSWEVLKGGTNALSGGFINDVLRGSDNGDARGRDICAGAETHWRSAQTIGTRAALEDHRRRYGSCNFAELANEAIKAMDHKAPATDSISSTERDPKLIDYSPGLKLFSNAGSALAWYYRNRDGAIELYDAPGHHPRSGEKLLPITTAIAAQLQKLQEECVTFNNFDANGKFLGVALQCEERPKIPVADKCISGYHANPSKSWECISDHPCLSGYHAHPSRPDVCIPD